MDNFNQLACSNVAIALVYIIGTILFKPPLITKVGQFKRRRKTAIIMLYSQYKDKQRQSLNHNAAYT